MDVDVIAFKKIVYSIILYDDNLSPVKHSDLSMFHSFYYMW